MLASLSSIVLYSASLYFAVTTTSLSHSIDASTSRFVTTHKSLFRLSSALLDRPVSTTGISYVNYFELAWCKRFRLWGLC